MAYFSVQLTKANFFSTVLAPPVLTTSSASTDTIDVSWGAIDQAAKYIVSIHLDSLQDTTEQETTGTSVTISGLEAGQLYVINCWALDAEDVTGETSSEVTQVTSKDTQLCVCVKLKM